MAQHWQDHHQDYPVDQDAPVYQVLQPAPFAGNEVSSIGERTVPPMSTAGQSSTVASDRFNCELCHKTYASESHLLTHLQVHSPTKAENIAQQTSKSKVTPSKEGFCCELCGKTYTTSSNLYKHSRTHKGITYKCPSCPKSFRYKETLKRHELSHLTKAGKNSDSTRTFQCPYCPKVMPTRLRLGIHLRSHPLEKPYKCSQCDRTFSQQSGCMRHRLTHSAVRAHACSQCRREFLNKENLRAHLKTHSAKRPFSCDRCGKAFSLKRTLEEHEKLHEVVKTYECQCCGKGFRQRSTLWSHEKIHKRGKTHKCGTCSEGFGTSRELLQHEKKHWTDSQMDKKGKGITSVKCPKKGARFTCKECGEAFVQKSVLQTHMRRHTGEMPFKCRECGKQFRHLASHRRHAMIHTGVKPFKCDICEQSFTKKKYLEWHLKKPHTKSDSCLPGGYSPDKIHKSKSDVVNDDLPSVASSGFHFQVDEHQSEEEATGPTSVMQANELPSIDRSCTVEQSEYGQNVESIEYSTPSHILRASKTPVEADIALADRVMVSFQDVCEVPINEECVQTMNLLEHVMQLTQISQRDLEETDLSIDDVGEISPTNAEDGEKQANSSEREDNNQSLPDESSSDRKYVTARKLLVCELCGRMYCSYSSLLRHKRSHAAPKPHKCDLCDKSYSRRPLLREHMQFAHSEYAKTHVCEYCEQAFPNATRLALHVRIHTGDKPYRCATCQKAFTDLSNFHRHERTHKRSRDHKCPQCDVMFVEKAALQRHLNRHRSEENFPCSACNKVFSLKTDLQSHRHVHIPARVPECSLCGLKFQREILFRQHQTCSKKMFKKCRICGESCASACARRQHEVHEHKFLITDSGFTCGVCDIGFSKQHIVIEHLRKHCGIPKNRRNVCLPDNCGQPGE